MISEAAYKILTTILPTIVMFLLSWLSNFQGAFSQKNNLRIKYSKINFKLHIINFVLFSSLNIFVIYTIKEKIPDSYFTNLLWALLTILAVLGWFSRKNSSRTFRKIYLWFTLFLLYFLFIKQIENVISSKQIIAHIVLLSIQIIILIYFVSENFISLYVDKLDINKFEVILKNDYSFSAEDIFEDKEKYIFTVYNTQINEHSSMIINKSDVSSISFRNKQVDEKE